MNAKLILESYNEVNFRSFSEANSYPKYWISEQWMSFGEAWINGILYFKGFGDEWTKSPIQRFPLFMKLIRLATKQDIVVP